jgi:hypothetical protein
VTILTLHKRVITHNTMIHVTHDEHNTWNPHLKVSEIQTVLTLHKRVITHNTRVHVTHDEHNTWNLHIKVSDNPHPA